MEGVKFYEVWESWKREKIIITETIILIYIIGIKELIKNKEKQPDLEV